MRLNPSLSIVSTMYRSAPFLDEFITRSLDAAARLDERFELVLVDDGSPDESLAIAKKRAGADPRIRVVELSRNFGHHAAMLAGLAEARGGRVFLVDSDLEEEPELLLEFSEVMRARGADVAFGVHGQSVGSWSRRLSSAAFWRFFNFFSEIKTEPDICNVRLMTRAYVDALLSMPERNVFLGGMFVWPGFSQTSVFVKRQIRRDVSTYTIKRRVLLMVDSVVSFSTRPLQMIFWLGGAIMGLSTLIAAGVVILKLSYGDEMVRGFSATVTSIWFLGGLNILSVGVVGIYVAYIYREVKARPRVIVKQVHEFGGESAP
jgi:putative glycosyltransferase